MNKRTLMTILLAGALFPLLTVAVPPASGEAASDQAATSQPKRFGDGRDWFFEKHFGMFVHWGIYAISGRHEQDQWRSKIPRKEYEKLTQQWNPTAFDPDAWIDQAQKAGMSYLTFTTKHHDGFCLWDSKQTSYTVMNTPYGKDVLKLLADACHRRNFPLCLYYSVVDWHNPNYPNQGRSHELPRQPEDQPDEAKYREFVKAQVRELCTNYGEIHGFWWDMNVPGWKDPSINKMIRELQPKAVINNRGFDAGDYGTPERDYDRSAEGREAFPHPTEACNSVGTESWGYRKNEDYATDLYLTRSIDTFRARGSNYLLNVGPDATGRIPVEAASILDRIGPWYEKVRESYENVVPAAELTTNNSVLLTRRGNVLYVHLTRDQASEAVKLPPLTLLPRSAVLLNTGKPVEFAIEPHLRLRHLPVNDFANTVLVVRLEFDNLPAATTPSPPPNKK